MGIHGALKQMKRSWKKIAIVCVSIGIVFSIAALADDSSGMRSESMNEQKARVASILSQYDASSLTAEDAKAINNAFRKAGIRNGPELSEAVKAAGFDGKAISTLDPPPEPLPARPGTSGQSVTKRE
jgi:hypothetical protein